LYFVVRNGNKVGTIAQGSNLRAQGKAKRKKMERGKKQRKGPGAVWVALTKREWSRESGNEAQGARTRSMKEGKGYKTKR